MLPARGVAEGVLLPGVQLEKSTADVERACERKIQESEDTCRRVREEYVHQCALEMEKQKDLAADNARLVQKLETSDASQREIEQEFVRCARVRPCAPAPRRAQASEAWPAGTKT